MDCESTIHRKVKAALYEFFCKDRGLLELNVNERSISHKLAEYLQQQFEGLQVDCEYNRHGAEGKTLPAREQTWSDNLDAETVYPDIIVHQRGDDDSNLLVIELKKKQSTASVSWDKEKLRKFTDPKGEYNYSLGLLLRFDVEKQRVYSAECYQKGKKSHCDFCESLKGFDGR